MYVSVELHDFACYTGAYVLEQNTTLFLFLYKKKKKNMAKKLPFIRKNIINTKNTPKKQTIFSPNGNGPQ